MISALDNNMKFSTIKLHLSSNGSIFEQSNQFIAELLKEIQFLLEQVLLLEHIA